MNAKEIIETIGAGRVADATGQSANTVSHWKARGIPTRHWLAIAREAGRTHDTRHVTIEVIEASKEQRMAAA